MKRLNFQDEAERIIQVQRSQIQQLTQDLRLHDSAFRLPSASSSSTTAAAAAAANTTATRLPKL